MSDVDKSSMPVWRRGAIVSAFALVCALMFGFLWTNSGGRIPVVSQNGYTVSVELPRVSNLVYFSDVMVAGIKVGKVQDVTVQGDHALVEFSLDEDVVPLHEGATVRVRAKSLVEESYLEVVDGGGPSIADGAQLPADAGRGPVQLDDVLQTLDAPTRKAIQTSLASLAGGTKGNRAALERAVVGLGYLGREGETVLDAVAGQSDDLTDLTRNAARLLSSLSSSDAALASLVDNAELLVTTSAAQREDIEATMRLLPPVIDTAVASTDDITVLGDKLLPVARNLDAAAPDLTIALRQLPRTSRDLSATVPYLDGVLDLAPQTLTRVPTLSEDVEAVVPHAEVLLSDVNPMLGYLEPYGKDVAAFFTNFAQTLQLGDVWGKYLRVMPPLDEQTFKGYPLNTNIGPLDKFNPLPLPGSLNTPVPYGDRDYPRVEREPVPE
jgi:phospholipid/cholesterol/gamma-HCH transport system substrate-binding protein